MSSFLKLKLFLAISCNQLAVLYLFLDSSNVSSYFPLIVIGILVIGIILGIGKGGEGEAQAYPGGYADLLGGGLGGGGMGGG